MIYDGTKLTPFKVKYVNDGVYVKYYDNLDRMLRDVSRHYAFDGLYSKNTEILEITVCDRKLRYIGQRPGMKFIYVDDETNEIIWEKDFPEWCH